MSFYRNGFAAETYVAGIISRSKYIQQVRSPWTVPQLLKLAKQSKWLWGNARNWIGSRSFNENIPSDALDSIYGIDFLIEIDGELIAVDLTLDGEQADKKLARLRQSATCLSIVDKWCVLVWDSEFPLSEQDLLDIYLDDQQFQLMFLININ